ncbi:winged helix-turn-helix transcriptional regulator [Candidatus Woesearchaeota archaeon]|nr:winged helix-turn-helix transcriptional regulator [Candidatus Woesearchaeota archaeon]
MVFIRQRITIVNIRKPAEHNVNQELQWFGTSLGLFNLRDKDKSTFRVFIELLKSAKRHETLTSDELATRLALARGTIIHHINKLMESGLVVHEGNKYTLRVENLKTLIEEVEKDIKRACDDLKEVAKEIDARLGI